MRAHPLQSWDSGDTARHEAAAMNRATLLEGGLVVDGSGGPSWPGDVLLVGDRIAGVGEGLRDAPARRACAGRGRRACSTAAAWSIAPGFIDVHTHDDAIVLDDADMLPKLSQGITTVVTGNCGISLAPYVTDAAAGRRSPARRRLVPLPDDARLRATR